MSNPLVSIIQSLLRAFCGGSGSGGGQQDYYQNQQQQQQQHQQYPPQGQQWQQQQQGYPPQQQPGYQQPQHQQNGQSWSQVAGGASPQHHQNQQHHQNNQHQQQPWQEHRPQGLPSGGVVGPHHPHYQNQDLINATNDQYQNLRNQARHEGDKAHQCFAQSQQAYQSGDGARAHELSQEGKQHAAKQDQLDDQASAWIFNENNKQSPNGTIDLHGLYVKEAIERTEAAISQAQQNGQSELRVIVGKGIHSQGHVARIKPAVEDLMRKYNLSAHLEDGNSGVLVVDLTGQTSNGRTRDAGGLVDEIERKGDGDCVIM